MMSPMIPLVIAQIKNGLLFYAFVTGNFIPTPSITGGHKKRGDSMKAFYLFTAFYIFGTTAFAANQVCSEYCRCSRGHIHFGANSCGFTVNFTTVLIPLNEESNRAVASLPETGRACFKGTQAPLGRSGSGFFAYEVSERR